MEFVTKVLVVLFGYVTLFYGVLGFHNDPKCGQNVYRQERIIGGEKLNEAEFPWYVSIKETGKHECSGFIINQRMVLTASHCFQDFSDRAAASPRTISVTLAAHHFSHDDGTKYFSKYTKWEQDVKVKRIIRHPQYDAFNQSGKFDIAILLLETKIQWNHATLPVCLPTKNESSVPQLTPYAFHSLYDSEFKSGELATVAGWDTKMNSVKGGESTLQKVQLKLYDMEECKRLLLEKNIKIKTDIDSSVICAGSNDVGFDSCSGDSGSALLVQRGNSWVAIGIVSSGYGKCGAGRPGLYTRISSYMDFIDFHNNQDQLSSSILFGKLKSNVPK
ncbi:Ovochymase-2 [Orchesella cincta]|uniref:Ovochymase-2 n=1 Tax=Orchesella cincta TaxID=48709 RepID=A0A1D2N3Q2_ORCCI|nr:Ovochymase-2 [Orchesella cincta]